MRREYIRAQVEVSAAVVGALPSAQPQSPRDVLPGPLVTADVPHDVGVTVPD
jgi:hypothetical protein